tara:strand:+ start:116 stop:286 length:171 start_codon:yes stop_codon:yes gene_type:complete
MNWKFVSEEEVKIEDNVAETEILPEEKMEHEPFENTEHETVQDINTSDYDNVTPLV